MTGEKKFEAPRGRGLLSSEPATHSSDTHAGPWRIQSRQWRVSSTSRLLAKSALTMASSPSSWRSCSDFYVAAPHQSRNGAEKVNLDAGAIAFLFGDTRISIVYVAAYKYSELRTWYVAQPRCCAGAELLRFVHDVPVHTGLTGCSAGELGGYWPSRSFKT